MMTVLELLRSYSILKTHRLDTLSTLCTIQESVKSIKSTVPVLTSFVLSLQETQDCNKYLEAAIALKMFFVVNLLFSTAVNSISNCNITVL